MKRKGEFICLIVDDAAKSKDIKHVHESQRVPIVLSSSETYLYLLT